MRLSGFADEAGGADLALQIKAVKSLGWNCIETRRLNAGSLASISDAEFEQVKALLAESGVAFNCFGSGVGNWAKPICEPPDSSYDELRKAIPRMKELGIPMIRIMSFAVPDAMKGRSWDFEDEVVKRVKRIVEIAEEAGILCLHENCMNWGGLSYEHTLKLLERVDSPQLKLVFDTGNPVVNDDVRGPGPHGKQSAWDFYRNVREHIAHVHVKDARMDGSKAVFTFPGEGDASLRSILDDLLRRGYDGDISIEPHMVRVFHDSNEDSKEAAKAAFENFIEYGKRLEAILSSIKSSLPCK